ncbi:hypothetical protein B0H14DRAFT_2648707 [Mycena olivaceomarginata]|nr:hypothetical protein B0H14DRAFT_2648707 [Mycena olivaceomarginata]
MGRRKFEFPDLAHDVGKQVGMQSEGIESGGGAPKGLRQRRGDAQGRSLPAASLFRRSEGRGSSTSVAIVEVFPVMYEVGEKGIIDKPSEWQVENKQETDNTLRNYGSTSVYEHAKTIWVLANSGRIGGPAVGHYLCEQSVAFCQIVFKNETIQKIRETKDYEVLVNKHRNQKDPLPIPFDDPEPQVMIPYTTDHPWHVQVRRDTFPYGDVGPRADPRVVVDLCFFRKQDIDKNNFVDFGTPGYAEWSAGCNRYLCNASAHWMFGLYCLKAQVLTPRSAAIFIHSAFPGHHMTVAVNALDTFLPGSQPQFMDDADKQGDGTTNPEESVADHSSRVHGFTNLWVGGNGCIPDSTVCNPTITSVTIALKGAEAVIQHLGNTANYADVWNFSQL